MVEIKNIRVPPKVDTPDLPEQRARGRSTPQESWAFEVQGQKFNFKDNKILLNGQNLSELIGENLSHLNANYWTTLSRRLAQYRDWATINIEDPEALSTFLPMVQAFLTNILGRVKKKFDETVEGVSFHLEDGQLLLNGINVHAFLEMVRKRRREKKRRSAKGMVFLKGLKNRLEILQRSGNSNYEKIRNTVNQLVFEIDRELHEVDPDVIPLPPPKPLSLGPK